MPTETNHNRRQTLFALVGRQHDLVVAAKEQLAHQRQELLHFASALRAGWEAVKSASRTRLSDLRLENRSLKNQVESLQAQHEQQRQAREAEFSVEVGALRAELRDTHEVLAKLQASPQTSAGNSAFSDEREQLERDRRLLDQDLAKAEAFRAELQEAARQAELALSRERANLARERVELTRIKEELRHELERAERCAEFEERLAPVQRLHEELVERQRQVNISADTPLPTPLARSKPGETRWRILLKKLSETKA
jgi:hypothetical protein